MRNTKEDYLCKLKVKRVLCNTQLKRTISLTKKRGFVWLKQKVKDNSNLEGVN